MKFTQPIYWKCKHFKQEAEKALKTNSEFFESIDGFKLIPFSGTRTDEQIIWSRKQIQTSLKYQN